MMRLNQNCQVRQSNEGVIQNVLKMRLNQNCQVRQSDLGTLTMMKPDRNPNLLIDTALVLFNLK